MAEQDDSAQPSNEPRRGFLVGGIVVLGAGVAATALGPVLALVTHPLEHDTTSGSDAFLPVGKPSQFSGEAPTKVDLYADRIDAWNRVVQVKVGSAWVIAQGGQLVAYSTVCPHLGCGIDYDADRGKFLCACHKTWFGTDGTVEEGPSPRGMDALELKRDDQLVSIRYQRFKQGVPGKEPIA